MKKARQEKGEERKTQGSTTEEMEREAKGDLDHNPLLNFTRSRFTKDPRAGPASRALPHTFNKLRALLCVLRVCTLCMCVCHTEVDSSGKLHAVYYELKQTQKLNLNTQQQRHAAQFQWR